MADVVLWGSLLLVAVGLPLLVLLTDRRAAARAHYLTAQEWEALRGPALSLADQDTVQQALNSGAWVDDPRLRAVVVDRARAGLGVRQPLTARRRRLARLAFVVAVGYTLVVAVWVVREPSPLILAGVGAAGQLAFFAFRQRRLRAVLRANIDA